MWSWEQRKNAAKTKTISENCFCENRVTQYTLLTASLNKMMLSVSFKCKIWYWKRKWENLKFCQYFLAFHLDFLFPPTAENKWSFQPPIHYSILNPWCLRAGRCNLNTCWKCSAMDEKRRNIYCVLKVLHFKSNQKSLNPIHFWGQEVNIWAAAGDHGGVASH